LFVFDSTVLGRNKKLERQRDRQLLSREFCGVKKKTAEDSGGG
jgi:hypothetical protein